MPSNVMNKFAGKPTGKGSFASPKLDMRDAVSCELSFEKCRGGFRIHCCCDDAMECDDLQCLCEAICECNCSCCCVRDENQICNINLCDHCTCENTKDGC